MTRNTQESQEELLEQGNESTDSASAAEASPAQETTQAAGDDKLRKLEAERDALFDKLARLQAEFENYRKRASREQAELREYVAADMAKQILPVLDSFDLALRLKGAAVENERRLFGGDRRKDELRTGVELIRRQMEDLLNKFGVRPISAVGQEFDPRFHEAIEMVDTKDAKDHQVLEELQRGYKIKDRLLRPAMVKVARNPRG
jgi:molecular chaperone GrpE